MKQKDHRSTEITDGVRLTTDFTKSGFGTPRECIVIIIGGIDLDRDELIVFDPVG